MPDSQSPTAVSEIEQAVTDYFEAWFDGDVDRMQRCLHRRLAKRRPPKADERELHEVSYDDMIADVSGGPKREFDRRIAVAVLATVGDIATAKVESEPFEEYIHLARIGGRWLIVNTLYERRTTRESVR